MTPPKKEPPPGAVSLSRRSLILGVGAVAGAATVGIDLAGRPLSASAAGTVWPNGSTTRPTISDPFGWRPPGSAGLPFHAGVDFVGFPTAHAVEAGTVVAIGWLSGWEAGGYQVLVQHAGFTSRYLHMVNGSAQVSTGQSVSAGTPIGTVGNTGGSYGVHLHLEINPGNGQIDPVPFLTARINGTTPLAPSPIGLDVTFLCITPINGSNADAGIYRWVMDPAAGTKRNIDGAEYDFLKTVGYRELSGLQSPAVSYRYQQISPSPTQP
ncbi:M23 family metallopeptidase [Microbacterium sp. NPDC056052]|uniref:M23 family metallopeptidase n=1 Tax=Microbacterium sp. NPDC056052 TaxID=3345695 RepID=UPI0035D9D094